MVVLVHEINIFILCMPNAEETEAILPLANPNENKQKIKINKYIKFCMHIGWHHRKWKLAINSIFNSFFVVVVVVQMQWCQPLYKFIIIIIRGNFAIYYVVHLAIQNNNNNNSSFGGSIATEKHSWHTRWGDWSQVKCEQNEVRYKRRKVSKLTRLNHKIVLNTECPKYESINWIHP